MMARPADIGTAQLALKRCIKRSGLSEDVDLLFAFFYLRISSELKAISSQARCIKLMVGNSADLENF